MIFLKLGGSLITNKGVERSARHATIERLAREIYTYHSRSDAQALVIGHGSGSFGHHAAARYRTQLGASTAEDWRGFTEVWQAAAELNQIVTKALLACGLPAITLSPSASAICRDGELISLKHEPVAAAVAAGLVPLVHGDVAFDETQGAAIVSTEAVFAYLGLRLRPTRMLLAGLEAGIYRDYPTKTELMESFSVDDLQAGDVGTSAETDVTGGMLSKARFALEIKTKLPEIEIQIFSGDKPNALLSALLGERIGTWIRSE